MVKQRKGIKMATLEMASRIANKLRENEEFPMESILKWFESFKNGDQFGVFYSDTVHSMTLSKCTESQKWSASLNMRESAQFYCNAPDYHTAIKDIIAEMPFAAKLVNSDVDEFVVKMDGDDYYRKWYIVRLL